MKNREKYTSPETRVAEFRKTHTLNEEALVQFSKWLDEEVDENESVTDIIDSMRKIGKLAMKDSTAWGTYVKQAADRLNRAYVLECEERNNKIKSLCEEKIMLMTALKPIIECEVAREVDPSGTYYTDTCRGKECKLMDAVLQVKRYLERNKVI